MAGQLENKVALVTGAGSGIGKASALLFAKEGARVAALGRTKEAIDQTVEEIKQNSGEAMAVLADISDAGQMQRAIDQIIGRYKRLDVVFANAGINGVWAPIEELEPDEWDRTININLRGTYLTVKYAVPHLKKQGGSVIVNSSVNGTRMFSNTGATAYACTKAAQVTFTRMIALELAPSRVRVNAICPGAIKTNINESTEVRGIERGEEPVPLTNDHPGSAEQVARLALFLASEASDHITGAEIFIDGAQSLIQG
ncbi:MAG TPA: SDR family NAD(P)-dependent oxidoreductase [Blastocatellia bacterium]|jgi:NAD(P)-dependent dehydrogenase (short-subunit alcohol dehydrogenase family)